MSDDAHGVVYITILGDVIRVQWHIEKGRKCPTTHMLLFTLLRLSDVTRVQWHSEEVRKCPTTLRHSASDCRLSLVRSRLLFGVGVSVICTTVVRWNCSHFNYSLSPGTTRVYINIVFVLIHEKRRGKLSMQY